MLHDAALILLTMLAAACGGGAGVWWVARRYVPLARPWRADHQAVLNAAGVVPPGGPCDHVWTGHPVQQDVNGFRVHRCVKCGDELAVAGRA